MTYLHSERGQFLLALSLLTLLTVVAIIARPMTPIDETRYISVAWEMWLRGDYLVPFKNGAPYSHKPPLMIWMYQLGWAIFGVNEWWPRMVSPLVSAGGLLLTMQLARRLWPERTGLGGSAVLVLSSCLLWTVFSTSAMFDVILAFITLIGMHGTLTAANGDDKRGFAIVGLAIGLGVLAKGPVILLHLLPAAVLAPWWNPGLQWKRWFGGIGLAILLGAVIALAWAIPAGFAGGEAYRRAIFWGQTADRMVQSFAHNRPLWWYLPILPAIFFPWLLWPGLWRSLASFTRAGLDRGGRFCLAWLLPVFIAFSLISGKQPHYLIPIFPAFALLVARSVTNEARVSGLWLPSLSALLAGGAFVAMAFGWLKVSREELTVPPDLLPGLLLIVAAIAVYARGRKTPQPLIAMTVLGAALSAGMQLALIKPLYPAYDIRPMAQAIKAAQESGRTVAHLGDYHDQYHFAGRLQQPLVLVERKDELSVWLAEHPDAYVVVYSKNLKRLEGTNLIASQHYLGAAVALVDAPAANALLAIQKAID